MRPSFLISRTTWSGMFGSLDSSRRSTTRCFWAVARACAITAAPATIRISPATPNRTIGTRPTGISRTAIFAATAVLAPAVPATEAPAPRPLHAARRAG